MNTEKSQNVALITQSTSEKKETCEATEEALVVKNMSRYVAKEIERRKPKIMLAKPIISLRIHCIRTG